ncbi:hypothetical protein Gotur_023811 [Gossypium turneri]
MRSYIGWGFRLGSIARDLGSCWLCPIASAMIIQVKTVCACNSGISRV